MTAATINETRDKSMPLASAAPVDINSPSPASGPPALRPLLDPAIADLLANKPDRLLSLVEDFGSPLNIVWPHILGKNLAALKTVLDAQAINHEIFYAAKVNKSQSLVHAAVESGLGIDASSLYEFRDALKAGADPARICGTGPAKTRDFLRALVEYRALISIDSMEELAGLEDLLPERGVEAPVRVTLRYRPTASQNSRFGMPADDIGKSLTRLAEQTGRFHFEGFHFHLGGYRPEARAEAVAELAPWVVAASALGLTVKMIDVGGGLPIRYVDSESYDVFLQAQDHDHYRNGIIPASFYPYGGRMDAQDWLSRFLAASCGPDATVADFLKREGITLGLEPGRCLADQTAITVFRITRVKSQADGNHILFVEGSSFSACETWFNSEFLVDPVLLPCRPHRPEDDAAFRAYIAGHSCLDEDIITNRLISFPARPQAGDLLVYANTAGYQMDLLENEFHRVPMPRRIAVNNDLTTVIADDLSGEVE